MVERTKLRVLVTAGPTREYIDSVRYLSNDSSGRMGFALAEAAARRGHRVTLIHGPVALERPEQVTTRPVVSARDMLVECLKAWPRHDVLVMAAAVADYTPARRRTTKMKKTQRGLALTLKPTSDVLATLAGNRRTRQIAIGFALEDRNARRNAQRKLRAKHLDAIILNRPTAIGARRSQIEVLVDGQPWRSLGQASKRASATTIMKMAETLAARA